MLSKSVAVLVAFVCSMPLVHANFWDDNLIVDWQTERAPGYQYGLRGIALSPDQNYVYGAWMHGDGIRWLYMYDAKQTAGPDANPEEGGTRHYLNRFTFNDISTAPGLPGWDDNTDWRAVSATNQYVYAGLDKKHRSDGLEPTCGFMGLAVLDPHNGLTPVFVDRTFDSGVNGVVASGSYLYVTQKDDASWQPDPNKQARITRYRIDVTPEAPQLDTTWGDNGVFNIAGAMNLRGVTIDGSGNLYMASSDATEGHMGKLYRVDPSTYAVQSVDVMAAMDVAIYQDVLYVTEYNGTASGVHRFDLNLNDLGYLWLDPDPTTAPHHQYTGGGYNPPGGFSGIAISNFGNVYLADQYWNDSVSPRILTDRLYRSDPLPEPGTLALFGVGIPALLGVLHRKRNASRDRSAGSS